MIVSPWSQLNEAEQLAIAPKLGNFSEDMFEVAAERFNQFVIEYDQQGAINHRATEDNLLTAQNFIAQASGFWKQIVEIKGFRRSYLELTVTDRDEFLRVLTKSDYVINREPFWTIHKFDSARELTDYSHQPSLHFANDRADEAGYGHNYFFVHWDKTSCWFRKSNWPIRRLPGVRQIEQLYAAVQHRFGCACPQTVSQHLKRR
ncbi:MAG: hypothetical protein KA368_05805 [Acidobacteria bacterium]|nr:hypothetical protein [Acidobacteriota bacterium]